MKHLEDIKTENYQNYTIITEEGTESGLFFRCPIRKHCFTVLDGLMEDESYNFSIYDFADKVVSSRLFRIKQYLLGNGSQVKDILKGDIFDDFEFYGLSMNIIVNPIYFNRDYRKLTMISTSEDNPIEIMESFGYNDYLYDVAGDCNKETTKIKYKYKKKKEVRINRNRYKYTYTHIAREIVKFTDARDITDRLVQQ